MGLLSFLDPLGINPIKQSFRSKDKSPEKDPESPESVLDRSTNKVLDEVSRQSGKQTALLGGLLEEKQARDFDFRSTLTSQSTQLGTLFEQIINRISTSQTEVQTEAERANTEAARLSASAAAVTTGRDSNLGQGFTRGRATTTSSLFQKRDQAGSSRQESFQATR
jgi:hypothetical protein